ncbi:RNA polymerase sigma factor [Acetivibrio saccincola]|uniref:RNA polymerase sigma factor n=1 Tax=Acetivibrio saccincola TaxID=1677857 RepID=UPI001FA821F0|nr:sigma factor-like helix-turn-helix DNA-binding protein [Acetivibrio saccincola]
MYKTARNITLTYIKGLKRQETLAKEYLYENATKEGEPYQKLLREQDQKIDETRYTGQVIESLNPKEYHLYKQCYVEGKSIKEIASEKGISEAAVRMRLVRLRREVQNIVKKLKFDEK